MAPVKKVYFVSASLCPRSYIEKDQMKGIPYASAVGSLMYAQTCTRPNIAYAVCYFPVGLLPVKLNLPMVCFPKHWRAVDPDSVPTTISDLTGGYLSDITGELHARYRMLSSSNSDHYYINLAGHDYVRICLVMNALQCQSYKVNELLLDYIRDDELDLVNDGFLLPSFLSHVNISKALTLLRECYLNSSVLNKKCSLSNLIDVLCENIQRSQFEQLIISMADAYRGYDFYLPAYLDFRGRIYRSGMLHFHERDLARSLIIFGDYSQLYDPHKNILNLEKMTNDVYYQKKKLKTLINNAAFHYKSFISYDDTEYFNIHIMKPAMQEYQKGSSSLLRSTCIEAKHPFQLLSNILLMIPVMDGDYTNTKYIPIIQDASASAYQILSYFLIDELMAINTNLISKDGDIISDIYLHFLSQVKKYIKRKDCSLSPALKAAVLHEEYGLNRKIIKSVFMPLIYGKTLHSTALDLEKSSLARFFGNRRKDSLELSKVLSNFWTDSYKGMDSMIQLIRAIGCPDPYDV